MTGFDIVIEPLDDTTTDHVVQLIHRTLEVYEEAGNVIASTFRRLADIQAVYNQPGSKFFVARDMQRDGLCIGGAGIGSLHGLPVTEGQGEIRDMVVDKDYRGRGLGTRLLKRCIDEAREANYQRLYLETTPEMENAQKLFLRFGFRPVTQAKTTELSADSKKQALVPCYYILDLDD